MPIPFTCPHCGATSVVADHYAGQTGPCAQCRQDITIPAFADLRSPEMPVRTGMSPWAIVGIVAAAVAGIIIVAAALLLPAIDSVRQAAGKNRCKNNLHQIGVAIHNYREAKGTFPPAYQRDKNNRLQHSWRVLLLPYMDRQDLYDQYRFDEPWDGPHNRLLADKMPNGYHCWADTEAAPGETSYVMIVGPGAISDGPNGVKLEQITDGPPNTLMMVERKHTGINWMDPRDCPLDELRLDSPHPNMANVLFCDGSVRALPVAINRELLRGMATIAGGERVDLPQ